LERGKNRIPLDRVINHESVGNLAMRQEVLSHLSVARTAAILQDLVRARSQNPVDGEGLVANYLLEFLGQLGLEVTTQAVMPGRSNVVGRLHGSGGPVLAFNTHMDTVPEGNGWSQDPFGAEIIEGQLYGRGSVDAKGSLAAFLAAIEALVTADIRLRGDIFMTAVVDEETCSSGARKLVPSIQVDMAVIGEPTNLQVGIAHRGSLRPIVVVTGRTAHSSRPEQGINAIYQSMPVLDAFRTYAEVLRERSHPLCGSPSPAITMMAAGIAENVIPGRCEMTLDRRMIPGEVESDVLAEVREVLEEVRRARPDINVVVERTIPTTGGPSELDRDHPLVTMALQAAAEALGRSTSLVGLSGACDMTHFIAHGIPCVVVGPGHSAQAHQPDEHIDIQELNQGAVAYSLLAIAACGFG
jgi:acetylornithine deacetylase/succinyl-diaminopimelate desuccinylase family protein